MAEGTNLFVLERYNSIAEHIKNKGRATVEELAAILYVSPATIRRDLATMQKLGMIKRTHGGAIHIENGEEVSIFVRMDLDGQEKESAARVALSHPVEFGSVFIDNSSTCFALAERMDFSYKTVVTNGLQLASVLANRKNVNLFLLGGNLRYNGGATNGGLALSMLSTFRFDAMFCGAASVLSDGSYERSLETMELKKMAMQRSDKKILVVGGSKFHIKALYRVAPLEDFDMICTDSQDSVVEEMKKNHHNIFNS